MAKGHKKKQQAAKVNYKQQHRQISKHAKQENSAKQGMQTNAEGEFSFHIQAYDTWFFRESRPHDAAGASELSSLFPPPIRTLAGALRTYLGEQLDIDWTTLKCPNSHFDFEASLGNAEHLGALKLKGPWVSFKNQRLYPAPLYLMQKEKEVTRLQIGSAVQCDLGNVRLPEMPEGCIGYKTMEQKWLTSKGLRACLDGGVPAESEVINKDQLFSYEPRLGIARNNSTRTVKDGQLYQTQHLRLRSDVHIVLDASELDSELCQVLDNKPPAILRLGGEGRMASLQAQKQYEPLPFINPKQVKRLIVHFISPANFRGEMFPAGFKKTEQAGQTVWQGTLNGISLTIEAAVIGKAHREGGWDMKNHQPRPVKSYLPAGTAWYCSLTEKTDWETVEAALQGRCIGEENAYGRGQIVIGQWFEYKSNK